MKNNKLDKLEFFKLSNTSLHNVTGGDYSCSTGTHTCSGPNGDADITSSIGVTTDSAWATIGNTNPIGVGSNKLN